MKDRAALGLVKDAEEQGLCVAFGRKWSRLTGLSESGQEVQS